MSLNTRHGAELYARAHRGEALARGEAVVVGNRAGVVEWTSAAWSRLTGFPVEETIDKPITHFLEHAALEIELVDFVAQHFLEGRRCTVALCFDNLVGRRLALELDVEPIRGDGGDIDRFVAVVRESSTGVDANPASTGPREAAPTAVVAPPPRGDRRRHALAIAPLAAGAIARVRMDVEREHAGRFDALLDAEFEEAFVPVLSRAPGAPGHAIASARLVELLETLIAASVASEPAGPRHLTLLSGRLRPRRSHHSAAHPIPLRAVAALATPHAFLEVHDTSPHLDRDALARIRDATPTADPREVAWVEASALARQLGARLFFDSTPGCGNQIVVVFDVEGATDRVIRE